MALQQLSASLRQRQKLGCMQTSHVQEAGLPNVTCHGYADQQGSVLIPQHHVQRAPATSLEAMGEDISQVTRQVADLRHALSEEVQSLRGGLATVATALRAVRPALDEQLEQRAEAQAQVSKHLESCLHQLATDVAGICAVKAESRLAALELEAIECRRRLELLDELSRAWQQGGEKAGLEKAQDAIESLGDVLLAQVRNEFQTYLGETVDIAGSDRHTVMDERARLGRIMHSEERALKVVQAACKAAGQAAHKCELLEELCREARVKEIDAFSVYERRLDNGIRVAEHSLSCEMHSAVQHMESKLRSAQHSICCEMHSCVQAASHGAVTNLHCVEQKLGEYVTAAKSEAREAESLSRHLMSSVDSTESWVQDAVASQEEMHAVRHSDLKFAICAADSACRQAMVQSVDSLREEIRAEHCMFLANEEHMLAQLRTCDDKLASEFSTQAHALQSLAEAQASSAEQHRREERGLWVKVHEISKSVRDHLSAERCTTFKSAQEAKQELAEQLEGQACAAQDHLRLELSAQCEALRRDLSQQFDGQLQRAFAIADGRAERCMEDVLRERKGRKRSEERMVAESIEKHCEEMAKRVDRKTKDRCSALQEKMSESQQTLGGLREELRTFMDEQKLFCGYLDTEQRAYQGQVRQELGIMSRLLDTSLRGDAA